MDIYCRVNGSHFPGWDRFQGMCNTAYYDVHWNLDGDLVFTGNAPTEYTTSIIGNRTVEFIHAAAAAGGKLERRAKPFLVVAATRAPHGPQTPAPWYADSLMTARNRITPAFNHSGSNAVPWVADLPPITAKEAAKFDLDFRDRWRSLMSVDDLVEGAVNALAATGLLNTTYVVYSSDHGFHLGHQRLGYGKEHHFEFDARVPFLIRGPGIAPGTTPRILAGNVDMAPTFLALAGWRSASGETAPPQMDGRSFAPLLMANAATAVSDYDTAIATPRADTGTATRTDANASAGAAVAASNNDRSEFLIEFTGLTAWPHGYGANGSCKADGCKRINDCPNNTYRALRVVSNDAYMGPSA
jgi:arylsulfatase A-like enzyme